MARILVLYGTTDGHTAQIAEAIAQPLRECAFDVDVFQAGTIDPGTNDYDAFVIAASVHAGHYQKTVGQWVRRHAAEFGAKPSAFISVCLAVLQKDPKMATELDAIARRFYDAAGWRPTVVKFVAGALLYTHYNIFKRWLMKRIVAKGGGDTDVSRDYDYTDWNDLRLFATEFGRRVSAAA